MGAKNLKQQTIQKVVLLHTWLYYVDKLKIIRKQILNCVIFFEVNKNIYCYFKNKQTWVLS